MAEMEGVLNPTNPASMITLHKDAAWKYAEILRTMHKLPKDNSCWAKQLYYELHQTAHSAY